MKARMSRRYILLMAFIIALVAIYTGGLAMARDLQNRETTDLADSSRVSRKIGQQLMERSLRLQNIGEPEQLDFSLTATGKSQFELRFDNPYSYPVRIKIYNIIGNLVVSEEAPGGGHFSKTYDFSSDKMRLFVVEVGNKKHNLTKKVTTI